MYQKTIFVVLFAISFSSCGESLNDQKKSIFFETINSASKTLAVSTNTARLSHKRSSGGGEESGTTGQRPGSSFLSIDNDPMSSYLRESDEKCEWSFESEDLEDFAFITVPSKLTVRGFGVDCPVRFEMDFDAGYNAQALVMKGRVNYRALTTKLRSINDVYGLDLEMNGELIRGIVKFNLSGTLLSSKQGEVGVTGGGHFGGDKGELVLNFKFSEFSVEFRAEYAAGTSAPSYSLNGEGISEEELQKNLKDVFDLDLMF